MAKIHGTNDDDDLAGTPDDDEIKGKRGNDTINAGDGDNEIHAGQGDDTISAGAGDDEIKAGQGDDVIDAGSGDDTIVGGQGDDTIAAGDGDDTINAGQGDDTIAAGDGDDEIKAGQGDDVIDAGSGDDTIDAGQGDDTISAGAGDDEIKAGQGDDVIDAGSGDDTIDGGQGNDTIQAGGGNDEIDAGQGDDLVVHIAALNGGANDIYDGGKGVDTLRLFLTPEEASSATLLAEVESYRAFLSTVTNSSGMANDETFVFESLGLRVAGFENLEVLVDGSPLSLLTAQPSAPPVIVNLSQSTTSEHIRVVGDGDTQITTGSADDVVIVGNGANSIDVGQGKNRVTSGGGDDAVIAGDGGNEINAGDGNNRISTGAGPDTIIVGSGNDVISSGGDDDYIEIGDGDDIVNAGDGNDTIIAGKGGGDDIIDGFLGLDLVIYPSSFQDLTIDLRPMDRSAIPASGGGTVGDLLINAGYAPNLPVGLATGGDIGTDVLIGIEHVGGGFGNDTLIGDDADNIFIGSFGSDRLLYTESVLGYDIFIGQIASTVTDIDALNGDTGVDTLTNIIGEDEAAFSDATVFLDGRNNDPIAVPDTLAALEDDLTTFAGTNLLFNDREFDGDALTITSVDSNGMVGTVVLNASGTITYNPNGQFEHLGSGDTTEEFFHYTIADGRGGTNTGTATVTIVGVNDVATIGGDFGGTITEDDDATTLTAAGLLTISDPDAGESTFAPQAGTPGGKGFGIFTLDADGSWSYTADNTQAKIQALGAGQMLEDAFTAVSSDGMASQVVTMIIHGTNDAPTLQTTEFTIDENQQLVGQLVATDVDGDALEYVLIRGPDTDLFGMKPDGELAFFAAPDFENPSDADANNVYEVAVLVRDGNGAIDSGSVLVTVQDVNDPPVLQTTDFTIDENQTVVGQIVAIDQDAEPLTFSLTGSGLDDSLFTIDPTTGLLSFNVAPNFESPADTNADGSDSDGTYHVEVHVEDGNGGSDTGTITVTVQDANDAPVLQTTELSALENQMAVGQIVATDEDMPPDVLTFSLTGGGSDAALFTITEGGGLSFVTAPDFENPTDTNLDGIYEVEVQVEDSQPDGSSGGGAVTTGTVLVAVQDGNELETLTPNQGFYILGDEPGDRAGFSVSSAGDVNGDGVGDLILGAWAGDDAGNSAGEAYVVFGPGTGFVTDSNGRQRVDLTTLDASQGFIIQGDMAGDQTGFSVSAAGDVNSDGVGDLIVGALFGDDGGTDAGESYVVFGSSATVGTPIDDGNGNVRQVVDLANLDSNLGFIIRGDAANDHAGHSVSSAGDVDGDGIDDLIIGADRGNDGGSDAGEAYVVFGTDGGFGTDIDGDGRQVIDLTNLSFSEGFIIRGNEALDLAGFTVSAAGNIDGDSFGDLIIGAPTAGPSDEGEAYVVFGTDGGFGTDIDGDGRLVIDLADLSTDEGFIIRGAAADDFAGYSVASAGDVDGDGLDDLIIGAPFSGADNEGESYVVFGSSGDFGTLDADGRRVIDLVNLDANQGIVIRGATPDDNAGFSVSSAGDVNGDGLNDLILGAPNVDGPNPDSGAAYVVFGSNAGFGTDLDGDGRQIIDLANLTPSQGFIIRADERAQGTGTSVSSAADLNGDGFDDVIVGAPFGPDGGRAFVVFGEGIGGDLSGNVTEDAHPTMLTTTGALNVVDANPGEATFRPQLATLGSSGLGAFTLLADGTWSYAADNTQTAIQQLGAGQTLIDSFTALSADGLRSQTVTVTIHGVNDAPIIGGDPNGVVSEDRFAPPTIESGQLTITDIDRDQSTFRTQAGTLGSNGFGTFDLAADGTWTYTVDNGQEAIQGLGGGQVLTDSFNAVSSDGSRLKQVIVTITGSNDLPTMGGVNIGSVTKEEFGLPTSLTTSGALTIDDSDPGESAWIPQSTPSAIEDGMGLFTLQADGSWTYEADNLHPSIQALGDGDTLVDLFTAVSVDGTGRLQVAVTINGEGVAADPNNHPPEFGGEFTRTIVVQAGQVPSAVGVVTIRDPDGLVDEVDLDFANGERVAEGSYGTFELLGLTYGPTSFRWSWEPDRRIHDAIRDLEPGEMVTETVTIVSGDGSRSETLTVNIKADSSFEYDIDAFITNTLSTLGNLGAPNEVLINDADQSQRFGDFKLGTAPEGGLRNSHEVALGDVDGDGDLDAFIANFGAANQFLTNLGGTQQGMPGDFDIRIAPEGGVQDSTDVALGDLDGDGDLDAFITNWGQPDQVLLNGTNGIRGDFNLGPEPIVGEAWDPETQSFRVTFLNSSAVVLGDLDLDGDLDAYVAGGTGVLLNVGGDEYETWDPDLNQMVTRIHPLGTLQEHPLPPLLWEHSPPQGGGPITGVLDVEMGDFDRDGDLDIFLVGDGTLFLLVNETIDPNFPSPNELRFGGTTLFKPGQAGDAIEDFSNSSAIALGDFDNDGFLDVFVTNRDQPNYVFMNQWDEEDRDWIFELASEPEGGSLDSQDVALADLDSDGDLDAFVTNGALEFNQVLINQGGGQGGEPGDFDLTNLAQPEGGVQFTTAVALGDLDGDGVHSAIDANGLPVLGPEELFPNMHVDFIA